MNKGILYGIGAYVLWGFFPIYWKLLIDVPALEVIGHRIGWSFILLLIYVVARGQWRKFRASALNWRTIGVYTIASVLLSFNWLIYVWGVNAGFVVETSLGYFINPLFYVLLGVVFLGERLRAMQWIPIGLAAIGVTYLTFVYGRLPWIALSLAFTFGLYGFVKKLSPLGSLHGLTLETGIVFPVAVIYIAALGFNGIGAFLSKDVSIDLFLIGAGLVTTIPLLMFASAARQIPLTIVGLLQYIAPTIQFLIGVFIYKEAFDTSRFIGFSIVWVALIIFAVENYLANRMAVKPVTQA
ncbi:MAG TPA: EamA family transporter RarD [Anaerolineales bacterium]|nr:EamA family transporter RarD [Anaerolineales bacterium]